MKKLRLYFICVLSLAGLSTIASPIDPIAELLKKLEEYAKKYPTEKVYIHLDKPYYAIGDNIWFKAYTIDARTNAPSAISNILYVDLINEKDSITKSLNLPMMAGTTSGDFKLSDSLSEGNYRIRAYMQWMRNNGSTSFFDKTVKIGSGWTNKVLIKLKVEISSW